MADLGGGSSPFSASTASGGYSRRYQPGDAKSTDRRKLLTDRGAYISFLEQQVERASRASNEAEAANVGLVQLQLRLDELEDKAWKTARSVELAQAATAQAQESARASRQEAEELLRQLELRVTRLEKGVLESQAVTEAEVGRLRNELSLAVQELVQRLDDRTSSLRDHLVATDGGTSALIREAQATCVRLADDALSAAEASQRKVEDFAASLTNRLEVLTRQSDAALDALRTDVTRLQMEMTVLRQGQAQAPVTSSSSTLRQVPAPIAQPRLPSLEPLHLQRDLDVSVSGAEDNLERRLASRFGQQVLQLTEVMRHVLQTQAAWQQNLTSKALAGHSSPLRLQAQPRAGSPAVIKDGGAGPRTPREAVDAQRRAAVNELYKELRELESGRRKGSRSRCSCVQK